ncbi:hypothetical protein ACHAXR_011168, partial [Thalassiosira sp. AJA248-18]
MARKYAYETKLFFENRVDFRKSGSRRKRHHVETIEGLSLALEGIDDVHGSDGLAASMFRVGDRVTDDILEEDLEHTTGLLIDETRDTLDTTTTGETADSGLGDALDIIAKDLAMTLGASLSK